MIQRVEPGWDDLQALWNQQPAPPDALRAQIHAAVRRHSWLMRLATVSDVVAVLGFGALAGWMWEARPDPFTAAWIAIVLPLAVAKLAFGLWNRRGTWRGVGESTRAFVALSILRARAKLRLAAGVSAFVAVEVLAAGGMLVYAWFTERGGPGRLLLVGVLVMALAVAILAWGRWYGRRAGRELAELRELEAQLGEDDQF